jgi:enoyl-CoA hydratase/carnithine racemase
VAADGSATPPPPLLLTERRGPVLVLTLNRPQARNSLSLDLIRGLHAAIHDTDRDRGVSAVVLTGAPPAFCSGHDLKEMTARRRDADRGRAFFLETMQTCAALMQAIVTCSKPVIAAVDGIATAAGCQLVATCDLAVAGEGATFATPGVNIGLFCSTPMVALSRNVSRKAAMEMLLTGEPLNAVQARDIGLVNRVCAKGEALQQAIDLADRIASKPRAIVAIGKKAFYAQAEMTLADAYRYTADVMVENMLARDAEEGIGAFIEKREPRWES